MNHQNFLKKKFQKVFINRPFITFSLLSMSTVSPFSLESGCKISALKHIHQTFMQGFFRLFCKTLILKEVGRKDFWNEGKRVLKHTLILIRAHVYTYTLEREKMVSRFKLIERQKDTMKAGESFLSETFQRAERDVKAKNKGGFIITHWHTIRLKHDTCFYQTCCIKRFQTNNVK